MPKVRFNAQALGIVGDGESGDVGNSGPRRSRVAVVMPYPNIQSLFEGLGFSNVDSFPNLGRDLPTEDIDP